MNKTEEAAPSYEQRQTINKSNEYIAGLVVTSAVDKMMALSSESSPSGKRGWQLIFEKDERLQRLKYRTNQEPIHAMEDSERVEDGQSGRAFWRRR